MAYGFVNKNAVLAHNVDSLNRRGVYTTGALDNGSVMQLLTQSTVKGEGLVWVATAPSATAGLTNLWMAATDGVVSITVNGKTYKGLSADFVNDFVNIKGGVIEFFKPQIGDIIELTDDAIGGTKGSNTFAVATATQTKLQWGTAAVAGLSLKYLNDNYVSMGTGDITSQRKLTRKFEVVAIA